MQYLSGVPQYSSHLKWISFFLDVTTAEEMQPLFEPVREFIAKVGNLIKE